ncbi:hypothetical protein N7541_004767 [Penicillium brevicompactum]|uniref:BTB domain-containing protein n=1 Tax=Penicillium brevicompactum TaxID=5074 RepID=A0A9W9UV14_PENBR|nr:hypothetical protein N7541_004767 [Penicillium brevicompactum]
MSSSSSMVVQEKAELLAGPVCTILVGSDKQAFSVHEKLICDSSPFFRAALGGPWEEASEHIVKLPEEEPKIFSIYLHWVYYGKLAVLVDRAQLPTITGLELQDRERRFSNEEYLQLLKACVFADKILDGKFHDTIIRAVVERILNKDASGYRRVPESTATVWLFNNAPISAPICQLVIDEYVREGRGCWTGTPDVPTALPITFFRVLAHTLMEKRKFTQSPLEPEKYFYANSVLKRKR